MKRKKQRHELCLQKGYISALITFLTCLLLWIDKMQSMLQLSTFFLMSTMIVVTNINILKVTCVLSIERQRLLKDYFRKLQRRHLYEFNDVMQKIYEINLVM